ncbi:carboxymuconolactone decarboxylase family protein [Neisseria elongata]|uniref:carboxymuconolactone decarboxylase family protein n=1 Tax=Neisseria elongata TaxID=495 RepID=UPI0028D1A0DA|nr:carboxymuconolactone decarboxylase family protein [Neisseria elongata]
MEVRKAQGIRDPQGKSATDLGNADYYALGTQTLAELSQALTSRPIFDFAPALDYAIKAQLFGYQFARGNLAAPEWELVTLASLAAQGKAVNGQLRSHLWVLKNLGTGDEQMAQIFATLENVAGKEVADNARAVWAEVK